MDTLFSHITAVTMDEALHTYFDCFVGVTDGKISWLSKAAPKDAPKQIINGEGMVLLPGLINCHVHLPYSLLRGYCEDVPLDKRLDDYVFPREDCFDARAVKAASLLSIAECLRFGVTSVSDLDLFTDAIADAVAESGIKANLAPALKLFTDESEPFSFRTDPACRAFREAVSRWNGFDDGRIRIEAGIHAEYTSNHNLWDALGDYAAEEQLGMQLQLSETQTEHDGCLEKNGLTPAQLLDCHGLFGTKATAAHCVRLDAEDRALLAKRGVSAVHCPISNLNLTAGCADVTAMIKAGMNVALGTDGASESGNLDLFAQIKAARLLAKTVTKSTEALPAAAALMMATVCGARAQHREAECGMLKIGMDADLAMLDFTAPQLMPCHDVPAQLVSAASGHDVVLTMVRGNILYAAGKYPTVNLDEVVRELAQYAMPHVFSGEAGSR